MSEIPLPRRIGRGIVGYLISATYVLAAGTTLAPPPTLVGPRLNVAAIIGLVIAGLLAAGWVAVDAARGRLELRRLVTFVVTGWLLLLPLGAFGEWFVRTVLGAGAAARYTTAVVVFVLVTVSAGYMAYNGGWERARRRMGSGGLDRM